MKQEARYPFVKINKDANPRELKPGEYIDAKNLIYYNQNAGVGLSRESMEGTNLVTGLVFLPAGTNRCVGAAWDKVNNVIVFVNQNSLGTHGIYEIDLSDNSVSLVKSLVNLDSPIGEIEGLDFIENLIILTDNTNRILMLDKTLSISNTYNATFLPLHKPHPYTKPVATRDSTATAVPANFVGDKALQFAYRYKFLDNTKSTLSPFSNMVPPVNYPDIDEAFKRVEVDITVTADIVANDSIVDKIEVFVREGENGVWYFFDDVDPNLITGLTYLFVYDGTNKKQALSEVESGNQVYDIPLKSRSLAILKNYLIADYNTQGYSDFGNPSFTLASANESASETRAFLPKGRVKVGIVYYDKFMRPSFVKAVTEVNISDSTFSISTTASVDEFTTAITSAQNKVTWTLAGSPPSWALYYQLYMTPDLHFQDYVNCVANLYFFRENGTSAGSNEVLIDDRLYYTLRPGALGVNQAYNYIDLLIPANLGFTVDTDCYVRITSMVQSQFADVDTVYFRVLEVNGNFIRIDRLEEKINSGVYEFDWTSERTVVNIEIVRFKETDEEVFYAASDVYTISGGAHGTTSGAIFGRDFIVEPTTTANSAFYLEDAQQVALRAGSGAFDLTRAASGKVFSQTNAFSLNTPPNEYQDYFPYTNYFKFVIDRSLANNDYGRPNIENNDEEQDTRTSTLSYSQPFIQDSLINGINQFFPANKQSLAISRGSIRKIVAVDEDVALIIHDRTCTSAYIQEGFVKFVDGTDALTKTDEVIGQERKSRSNYGTINPESVAVLQNKIEGEAGTSNKVYWWDQNEGVVCRHSGNGIIPISDYGMKQYFRDKAKAMAGESSLWIPGGCHPYWDCYIITFPAYGLVPSETWVFSEEVNGWIGRIETSSIPERYVSSGRDLFSFVSGVPYIHNNTSNYNTFYGSTEDASITFIANTFEEFQKIWHYVKMQSNTDQVRIDFDNEGGQSSYLANGEYREREGDYFGDILRDINTNAALLEAWQVARLHGNKMRSDILTVKLTFTGSTKWVLNSVSLGFKVKPTN